jgi:hypothetical protein
MVRRAANRDDSASPDPPNPPALVAAPVNCDGLAPVVTVPLPVGSSGTTGIVGVPVSMMRLLGTLGLEVVEYAGFGGARLTEVEDGPGAGVPWLPWVTYTVTTVGEHSPGEDELLPKG